MDRRILLAGLAASLAAPAAAWPQDEALVLPPTPGPTYEGMTFQSHGKAIRAIHYRPVGEGRRAAIVMMHGSGARITSRGP